MNQTDQRTILAAARDELGGAIVRDAAFRFARPNIDTVVLAHALHQAHWQRVFELMTPGWMDSESSRPEAPEQWLQRLADAGQGLGYRVETSIQIGEPGSTLTALALAHQADLVVVATPREDRIREFFLGSTVLSILRHAPCPILVARGKVSRPGPTLVAVVPDGTEQRLAEAATMWFAGTERRFVHCFDLPEEGQLRVHGYTEAAISKFKGLLRQNVEARLKPLRQAYPDAPMLIEEGYAAATLLELVGQQKPGVVVLGAHRGSRANERLLGSVAQFMLYNADVDLLLVP